MPIFQAQQAHLKSALKSRSGTASGSTNLLTVPYVRELTGIIDRLLRTRPARVLTSGLQAKKTEGEPKKKMLERQGRQISGRHLPAQLFAYPCTLGPEQQVQPSRRVSVVTRTLTAQSNCSHQMPRAPAAVRADQIPHGLVVGCGRIRAAWTLTAYLRR